jgi:DNA-binding NtrC family response regulator
MRRVAQEVHEVARCRAPVLIQGESGTGKDLVARALHLLSGRTGAYVPINAAAFPDSLADSELFGHCRGAFTGAVASRAGAFEQADAGTLFLDEVAELSPAVQVRLLRVVEDGNIRALGSTKEIGVQVRIVSASWADLQERACHGLFRGDLYHRLATITIQLPALRERKSDIPALCQALLKRFEAELGPKTLAPSAMVRLIDHNWPGNVRELGSVLYRAGLCAHSVEIESHHLRIGKPLAKSRAQVRELNSSEVCKLYEQHGRNTSAAARAARVPRSTFRGWLARAAQ